MPTRSSTPSSVVSVKPPLGATAVKKQRSRSRGKTTMPTRSTGRKRVPVGGGGGSGGEAQVRRRARNRLSAQLHREKQRHYVRGLEKRLAAMTKERDALRLCLLAFLDVPCKCRSVAAYRSLAARIINAGHRAAVQQEKHGASSHRRSPSDAGSASGAGSGSSDSEAGTDSASDTISVRTLSPTLNDNVTAAALATAAAALTTQASGGHGTNCGNDSDVTDDVDSVFDRATPMHHGGSPAHHAGVAKPSPLDFSLVDEADALDGGCPGDDALPATAVKAEVGNVPTAHGVATGTELDDLPTVDGVDAMPAVDACDVLDDASDFGDLDDAFGNDDFDVLSAMLADSIDATNTIIPPTTLVANGNPSGGESATTTATSNAGLPAAGLLRNTLPNTASMPLVSDFGGGLEVSPAAAGSYFGGQPHTGTPVGVHSGVITGLMSPHGSNSIGGGGLSAYMPSFIPPAPNTGLTATPWQPTVGTSSTSPTPHQSLRSGTTRSPTKRRSSPSSAASSWASEPEEVSSFKNPRPRKLARTALAVLGLVFAFALMGTPLLGVDNGNVGGVGNTIHVGGDVPRGFSASGGYWVAHGGVAPSTMSMVEGGGGGSKVNMEDVVSAAPVIGANGRMHGAGRALQGLAPMPQRTDASTALVATDTAQDDMPWASSAAEQREERGGKTMGVVPYQKLRGASRTATRAAHRSSQPSAQPANVTLVPAEPPTVVLDGRRGAYIELTGPLQVYANNAYASYLSRHTSGRESEGEGVGGNSKPSGNGSTSDAASFVMCPEAVGSLSAWSRPAHRTSSGSQSPPTPSPASGSHVQIAPAVSSLGGAANRHGDGSSNTTTTTANDLSTNKFLVLLVPSSSLQDGGDTGNNGDAGWVEIGCEVRSVRHVQSVTLSAP